MATWIDIPTLGDKRGKISIIEKILPFEIKRVYYLYDVKTHRGEHAHKKTQQAFICIGGSCDMHIVSSKKAQTYHLSSPTQCLLLEPHEWHKIDNFSPNAFLLVLASEYYDPNDYIKEIL